jgi:hypothetical protein
MKIKEKEAEQKHKEHAKQSIIDRMEGGVYTKNMVDHRRSMTESKQKISAPILTMNGFTSRYGPMEDLTNRSGIHMNPHDPYFSNQNLSLLGKRPETARPGFKYFTQHPSSEFSQYST